MTKIQKAYVDISAAVDRPMNAEPRALYPNHHEMSSGESGSSGLSCNASRSSEALWTPTTLAYLWMGFDKVPRNTRAKRLAVRHLIGNPRTLCYVILRNDFYSATHGVPDITMLHQCRCIQRRVCQINNHGYSRVIWFQSYVALK